MLALIAHLLQPFTSIQENIGDSPRAGGLDGSVTLSSLASLLLESTFRIVTIFSHNDVFRYFHRDKFGDLSIILSHAYLHACIFSFLI